MEVFSQIRDMDDDEDDEGGGGEHEFSQGIVWGYFEQAENTFKQMEEAMCVQSSVQCFGFADQPFLALPFPFPLKSPQPCSPMRKSFVLVRSLRSISAEPSLSKLSSLGHFLKGSSAALGIIKVQASCERMQHYGNMRDEEAGESLSEDDALRRIKALLVECKEAHEVAVAWMKKLYEDEA